MTSPIHEQSFCSIPVRFGTPWSWVFLDVWRSRSASCQGHCWFIYKRLLVDGFVVTTPWNKKYDSKIWLPTHDQTLSFPESFSEATLATTSETFDRGDDGLSFCVRLMGFNWMIWVFPKMGVPKIYGLQYEKSYWNWWYRGSPIFSETSIPYAHLEKTRWSSHIRNHCP